MTGSDGAAAVLPVSSTLPWGAAAAAGAGAEAAAVWAKETAAAVASSETRSSNLEALGILEDDHLNDGDRYPIVRGKGQLAEALAVAEMLRGGTTCCNENYFFPDVQAATTMTAMAQGCRRLICLGVWKGVVLRYGV